MIDEILSDPELKTRLSEGGRQLFQTSFTLDESIRRMASLYRGEPKAQQR
jgi:glycosyltransferase involved in cell wall biosynthesis